MNKTGYVNGDDVLMTVNGVATGHATGHTATFNAETESRSVKPTQSQPVGVALWDDQIVRKLSATVNAKGLCFYEETESGYKTLLKMWREAKPVKLALVERMDESEPDKPDGVSKIPQPYFVCDFIITKVSRAANAKSDVEYDVDFASTGAPETFDPTNITGEELGHE